MLESFAAVFSNVSGIRLHVGTMYLGYCYVVFKNSNNAKYTKKKFVCFKNILLHKSMKLLSTYVLYQNVNILMQNVY